LFESVIVINYDFLFGKTDFNKRHNLID